MMSCQPQKDVPVLAVQNRDFLEMSTFRVNTVSYRSSVSRPRYDPGFPLRESTYINHCKSLHKADRKLISATQDMEDESMPRRRHHVKFPVTDTRNHNQRHSDRLQYLMSSEKPFVSIQEISSKQLSNIHPEHKYLSYDKNRFHRKIYNGKVTCKMFVDRDKILYFKNCPIQRKATKSALGIYNTRRVYDVATERGNNVDSVNSPRAATSSIQGSFLTSGINHNFKTSFTALQCQTLYIQNNRKMELHPRCFYLKTPIFYSRYQGDAGGKTPYCKCRLCSLEKERQDMDKLDREDNIINTINIQLMKPCDVYSMSSSCPPSRPNSIVDDIQDHI